MHVIYHRITESQSHRGEKREIYLEGEEKRGGGEGGEIGNWKGDTEGRRMSNPHTHLISSNNEFSEFSDFFLFSASSSSSSTTKDHHSISNLTYSIGRFTIVIVIVKEKDITYIHNK